MMYDENKTYKNQLADDGTQLVFDGVPSFVCENCGAIYPMSEAVATSYGTLICKECFERDYFTCDDCGEVCRKDEMTLVNANLWNTESLQVCDSCLNESYDRYGNPRYVHCDDCGEWVTNDHISLSDDWRSICENCEDGWVRCEECGAVVSEDYAYYDDESGEYLCEDCYRSVMDERETNNRELHEYDFKPHPIFGTTDSHDGWSSYMGVDPTFGVELEIDGGDDVSDTIGDIADTTDRAYCKHDGSLGCDGIEIVTHPGTLAWHMEKFPWEKICKAALDHGYKSHDTSTCGLHVHVGRDQLMGGRDTIAKMDIVTARHKDSFIRFSRRSGESRWCAYTDIEDIKLDISGDRSEHEKLRYVYEDRLYDRYRAVNRKNSGTVEIRIFRGTLKYTTVLASIQLVSNLVGYCDTHTLDDCLSCTWDDIVHYKEYAELTAYEAARMSGFSSAPAAATPAPAQDESSDVLWNGANTRGNVWGTQVELRTNSTINEGDIVYDSLYSRYGIAEELLPGNLVRGIWFTHANNSSGISVEQMSTTDMELSLAPHMWLVPANRLSRVTCIGNYAWTREAATATLRLYHETGLLPGDYVQLDKRTADTSNSPFDPSACSLVGYFSRDADIVGKVLFAGANGESVLVRWGNLTLGHNGNDVYSDSNHTCWWVRTFSLRHT